MINFIKYIFSKEGRNHMLAISLYEKYNNGNNINDICAIKKCYKEYKNEKKIDYIYKCLNILPFEEQVKIIEGAKK